MSKFKIGDILKDKTNSAIRILEVDGFLYKVWYYPANKERTIGSGYIEKYYKLTKATKVLYYSADK